LGRLKYEQTTCQRPEQRHGPFVSSLRSNCISAWSLVLPSIQGGVFVCPRALSPVLIGLIR
jgi:hypothetical protein